MATTIVPTHDKQDDFNPPRGFERENFVAEKSTTNLKRKDAISAKSMNNPNPFVPQGSLLEQQSKRHSRLKFAVFCVLAVGVVGLTAMLIQGCKREQRPKTPPNAGGGNQRRRQSRRIPPADGGIQSACACQHLRRWSFLPPPVTEAAATEYVVVKGDTLAKIAKKNGVTLKAIEAANPGVEPTKLKVGQKLPFPPASRLPAAPAAAFDRHERWRRNLHRQIRRHIDENCQGARHNCQSHRI